MVNSKIIISGLALAVIAATAPFHSNTSFSITQVAVEVPTVPPATIYAQAYSRLGVKVPNYIALAARSGWTDSVIANPFKNDIIYLTPIQIGADILQVTLDTGSANLWGYTAQTPCVGFHATYNTQTGILMPGYHWSTINGNQIILKGRVFLDKIKLGHLSFPYQAVQVVDTIEPVSAMLDPYRRHDGIIGLAFSSRNTIQPIQQKTFFDNIKPYLNSPLFAVYLKHRAPGSYDLGWIDPSKYKGQLFWRVVDDSRGLWTIAVDGFSIGGDSSSSIPFPATIDTGTTLVLLQEDVVREYYKKIPGSYKCLQNGGYIFPCTNATVIPDFTLNFGLHTTPIPGELIKYIRNSTHCYGGIQPSPDPNLNVLGDIFLKSYYVIFYSDTTSPQIGIAPQA
ncbi:hypothetical protein TMatcc_009910 [Talaromyces marneffei ATCC 18224]|uniref:uncharacterized protein n=1 Tax=Talaromyces marneffei TaxID=37727 RepID=UPI0012AAA754|nr:uncharacterized protein EYB26_009132 [Talaromyces marneffei]QGA21422.1 hypothetical protein EYB26_009132 [Talaromyces marneffei]